MEGESATAAREGGRVAEPSLSRPGRGASWRALHVEAGILLGLVAREPRDALHEVEDALGRAALFHQHLLDDLAGFGFREAAFAQEVIPVLVCPRDDLLPRRLDAVHEALWRGIGKPRQRRGRLMGEARRRVFRVADLDLLKILDTPEVAVLAHRPQVEACHAERLGPHLGVPAIEAPEVDGMVAALPRRHRNVPRMWM